MPIDIFGRTGINNNSQTRPQIIDVTQFLHRDGSTQMTGNLDRGNNLIMNVADPEKSTDAAKKRYVDSEIEHLKRELEQNIERIITERVNEAVADAIENIENSTINPLFERI